MIPRFASLNDSAWVGCDDLLERLTEVQDIKYHIFGHIHEGYGVTKNKKIKDITFINASTVDVSYRCVNKPIMFYIKGRGRQYCDVKSLHDEDNDNGGQEEKKQNDEQEEDNPYKINENYENMNDLNNEMDLLREIPHRLDSASSNVREYSSNNPSLEDVPDDEL